MSKSSQVRPILAIAKSSLLSTLRNPSSIFFGILFPLIFILVFGFLGGRGGNIEMGITKDSDKNNPIYKVLNESDVIELKEVNDKDSYMRDLKKGEISAVIAIENNDGKFEVDLKTSAAQPQDASVISNFVSTVIDKSAIAIYQQQAGDVQSPITLETEVIEGREYKSIDFILPGQLGFSLLSSGVFGVAFLFVSLRDTLVIKRYFATPIKKYVIVLGEGISKLIFTLIQASVIIGVGHFAFDFTLINGVWTLFELLALSAIGLAVFLGFGFIISGIAKNENVIPPLANLVTMPQFLLAGTFFPIEAFPTWLQPVSRALPLTYLNDAMRKVAFDGESIFSLQTELLALGIWTIIVYIIAVKVFKWEN